ncbi:phosphoribosylaminoimidazole-succinocarboxamide synthase [Nannochloropsis gaditana]|uniref:phosphoribosylaminoimidazolesuccinocarboxamide synthase n=1 Tax=Nannochloropsis gaditana TaxID=72520 RepID=W7T5B3_9STRA|nr:phosphoribosylaminoimidazole-succinocarboxamide synthase [Nannochloropsis gaditana]
MAATAPVAAPTSALITQAQQKTVAYLPRIDSQRAHTVSATDLEGAFQYEKKYVGKVRDVYTTADSLLLISTDRQSAFDRNLASIPFKGQVLNLTSQWWFEKSKDLVPNHILAVPHPNACIGKKCTMFPVEFVMRGYITGIAVMPCPRG